MQSRTYSSEGIILARRSYGEVDRIISVYSEKYGRLSLLAKGVRRPTSRKRGHLEIFSQIKFSAAKGRSLDIITEAETIENFAEIRKDLKKAALAFFFMEVIGRTTHEGEPHRNIYIICLENLRRLKTEKKLKTLKNNFITEILTTLGFWPKGKILPNPDLLLESVTERLLFSVRVGKKLLN